jgi:NAD(P)-dependent dehydrogenase (short-subunit alcohol dehydrogenase family)
MDLGPEGNVAGVTGASRGLGSASAHALAAEGATIIVALAVMCGGKRLVTGTGYVFDGRETRALL